MTVATQTVRDIALENPATIRVFEKFGIDYCCGGRKPLTEACEANSIAVDEVIAALERAAAEPVPQADNWAGRSLVELVDYIINTHHAYVNQETPRLTQLAARVVARHGDTKPELPIIQAKVAELVEELSSHLGKEEMILFPHIVRLERAMDKGQPAPRGCFGTVSNPIAMMTSEHDSAGTLMAEIRKLSGDYTPPIGACPTFLNFYNSLREFEQDLHQHIHLENNILFPKAIALEQGIGSSYQG
ncbi:iron-sulfur cluster repair di-iron protein [Occallatibacter riparius]|uniref:Iron-sulfur cluster repair di-iron protein n=1 Tax=Occallatibacter riparius TaxID=1002689 RepID=A0A9J7BR37_9BACT|nr:iron-sulfur cluster repair di-iron protein [Occallatibacter riparius]UWZ85047.1 iron-sulfur cluster repair di-iron protein [Occallatibacter riparius]